MRLRVELDVIFEKYVHVTQLGTNLKNVTLYKTYTAYHQVQYLEISFTFHYLVLPSLLSVNLL